MKQVLVVLVVLGILFAAFYAFLYVNDIKLSELKLSDLTVENVQNMKNLQHMSGAGLAAMRALDMWDRGEYEKLYRSLSSDVRQVLPQDAFMESRNSLLIGGVLKPQIEDVKEEGDTATVTASIVNPDIKALTAEIFGDRKDGKKSVFERQKVLIELKREGDTWRISQFDPITEALRRMDEVRKLRRRESRETEEAEAYQPKVTITDLRAQAIHTYGPEPFIVGTVKNTGNRDVQKLGVRFTVRDAAGTTLVEDTYYPVVESSISEEERPLRPGETRKISYQLDRSIPGWKDTHNVTARVVELRVGPEYEDASGSADAAKEKIRRAQEAGRG